LNSGIGTFWRDERGAEMVEWAVVTIVLLGFTVVAIIAVKGEVIGLYQMAFRAIQEDPPDSYEDT
jgi:Flp pilus assembly pilin Flp